MIIMSTAARIGLRANTRYQLLDAEDGGANRYEEENDSYLSFAGMYTMYQNLHLIFLSPFVAGRILSSTWFSMNPDGGHRVLGRTFVGDRVRTKLSTSNCHAAQRTSLNHLQDERLNIPITTYIKHVGDGEASQKREI